MTSKALHAPGLPTSQARLSPSQPPSLCSSNMGPLLTPHTPRRALWQPPHRLPLEGAREVRSSGTSTDPPSRLGFSLSWVVWVRAGQAKLGSSRSSLIPVLTSATLAGRRCAHPLTALCNYCEHFHTHRSGVLTTVNPMHLLLSSPSSFMERPPPEVSSHPSSASSSPLATSL